MKRLTLLLTIAIITVATLQAQTTRRETTQEEVKAYLEKNVYPELEKQQTNYMDNLTKEEQSTIETLRNTRPQGRMGRGNMQPGSCLDEVKEITDKYPELNKEYIEFIDNNKDKWVSDIDKIHSDNNITAMRNKSGRTGYNELMNRVSEPEFLLLWDPEKPVFNKTGRMGKMQRPCCGRMNMQKKSDPIDPETEAKVDEYIQSNVIPVLVSERKKFDKDLTKAEQETIADARDEAAERKAEFNKWRESDDFVPGKRANDPTFDEQRKEMRDKMQKVRDIAQVHSTEIYQALNNIRGNRDKWQEDIDEITGDKDSSYSSGNKFMKRITPISFLMLDPENPELRQTGFKKSN